MIWYGKTDHNRARVSAVKHHMYLARLFRHRLSKAERQRELMRQNRNTMKRVRYIFWAAIGAFLLYALFSA